MELIDKGNTRYICVNCERQFIDNYQSFKGYSDEMRNECLTMYVNGMGLRAIAPWAPLRDHQRWRCAIARVKKIHHTTVINWVKQVAGVITQ